MRDTMSRLSLPAVLAAFCAAPLLVAAGPGAPRSQQAVTPGLTPDRQTTEGLGPFQRFVIRGPMLVDGTGAPPRGPVDIVVEGDRIRAILSAGTPGQPLAPRRQPQRVDYELDATGMYVLPGFVDLHVHAGGPPKHDGAEYAYKLWLAHGVTTVRGVPLGPHAFAASEKQRSARNEIVAPRIFNYQRPRSGWTGGPIDTPDAARAWVRMAAERGVDGLKLTSHRPEIMAALLDEAARRGLGSTAHLAQAGVAQMNALEAARLGLGTVTHFYGHFEALLKEHVVQPWPPDMNHDDEQQRFRQVASLWDDVVEPGSPEWTAYLEEHVELGTTFDPTFTIYSAGRDVMKYRQAHWHDAYTMPSLFTFYEPNRRNHGSFYYDWTTADEVAWRNFYQVWFRLVNDYKNMGGRVTTGSDSGFVYQTYGFGYINELELLQEAGFHPLEVVQAATMNGALTLHEPKGRAIEFGVVRDGLLADMVIVDGNPLENFKLLYGTGAMKLNDRTGRVERVGGVKYTIKDGIVYDAKQLRADVTRIVDQQKRERRRDTTP